MCSVVFVFKFRFKFSFTFNSVPVDPDMQFGFYIQVPMNKSWPHLLGFTVNAKDSSSFVSGQKILFNDDSFDLCSWIHVLYLFSRF